MVLMRRLASRRWRRRTDRDEGAVAVLVAVLLVFVIFPLMAIVVDVGLERMLSQQSRAAADAGALGAAGLLLAGRSQAEAVAEIKTMVAANLSDSQTWLDAAWSTCGDPGSLPTLADPSNGVGSCISFDFMKKRVRVTIPSRNVPTVFSGALGSSLIASATTTATWGLDPWPTCAICTFTNFDSGATAVTATNDDIAVGGDFSITKPGGFVHAAPWQITYHGSLGTILVPPDTHLVNGPVPQDPFAGNLTALRLATPNTQRVYGQVSNPVTSRSCSPDIYQDITTCTSFTPGTYFVTGRPDRATSVALNVPTVTGVTFFFTCSATSGTSVVAAPCSPTSTNMPSFIGPGSLSQTTITAPSSGPGAGLAIVFDQGLTGSEGIVGGGRLIINGSLYGPNIILGSTGTNTTTVSGGRVVVNQILFAAGNPTLNVTAPPKVPQPVPDGPVRLVRTS